MSALTDSMKLRTHCPQGHPYDEANTYVTPKGERTCRECRGARRAAYDHANPEQRRARKRTPRQREGARRRFIERRWGMTYDEYERLLANGCAICGTTEKIVLDHCHESGQIREALCSQCNVAIGMMRDDPERLRKAVAYLERHRV